ncbi:C-terminal domain of homeodomain 1-domain-containing protein [Pholiota molesta]|nr:C-terminal domain of homeodomain 1-domain-containing protein [Pholiota molesta]
MGESLHSQFLKAEETLVFTLSAGPKAVQSFDTLWSTLYNNLVDAMEQNTVDDSSLSAIHQVATRVQTLATRFLELYNNVGHITECLQQDLDAAFADLTLEDRPSAMRSDVAETKSYQPPYLESAYTWLLANLHNPYPSKETKIDISRTTGTSYKDIDAWFVNVRKRIGWNTLRIRHFNNKRSNIVKAASQFFKPTSQPSSSTLDNPVHSSDYGLEFAAIEACAQDLYSQKFTQTALAANIDTSIKDIKPKSDESIFGNASRLNFPGESVPVLPHHISAYPSPARSPDRSPEPDLPTILPNQEPISNKKRKDRDLSPECDPEDINFRRHFKRTRTCPSQNTPDLAAYSLPSPAASTHSDESPECLVGENALPEDPALSLSDIQPPTTTSSILSGKRKRCSSDSDLTSPSKRPYSLQSLRGPETILGPLPAIQALEGQEPSFDDWLQETLGSMNTFEIPSPNTSGSSVNDDLVPLEISCYQYDFSSFATGLDVALLSMPQMCGENEHMPFMKNVQAGIVDIFDSTDFPEPHFTSFSLFNETSTYPPLGYDDSPQNLHIPIPGTPAYGDPNWMSSSALSSNCYSFHLSPAGDTQVPVLPQHSFSNSVLQQSSVDDKNAKYKRVQQLRKELRQLEADFTS